MSSPPSRRLPPAPEPPTRERSRRRRSETTGTATARVRSGGKAADYVVDYLNRPLMSYWASRDG